ncbi:isoaspartyl peptidase/L-asparaginase [Aspergillus undulatus]|uniref:isoaspartyl peptidase/L-asparaginase n=1 Tax=Aspergillus undulatus TaxID=1810928 RepID=UPI003CCE307F
MNTHTNTMTPKPNPTFRPTLILHGGAGAIHHSTLPPDLWAKYHSSLLSYLRSTKALLKNGATALEAAVHAVSLMEDDELFNCGRGSVFTSAGTIEMEASVMVTSVFGKRDVTNRSEAMKRGVGVIGVRNVRHPIQLAREVLVRTGQDENGDPLGGEEGSGGSMHAQLSGPYVEELARGWGLGLSRMNGSGRRRGTVGCVCLDQLGGLAVATSTGGLTNKLPGRVGDTPTLGAGFWAEAWDVEGCDLARQAELEGMRYLPQTRHGVIRTKSVWDFTLADCFPGLSVFFKDSSSSIPRQTFTAIDEKRDPYRSQKTRRAVAVSGTGNGDAFIRTAAARTTCAIMRFSEKKVSLEKAVSAIAGADGELQRSAGIRWGKTSEGQGGIIGIEAEVDDDDTEESGWDLRRGKVVFDFNCGGMFRAWVDEGPDGRDVEQVMVFREAYQ